MVTGAHDEATERISPERDSQLSDYWVRAPRHGEEVVFEHLQLHRNILKELGYEVESLTTILDFGCGAGEIVTEYRKRGYQAFGCDIVLEEQCEFLRTIEKVPYRLPFADNSFDFVFSDQVLEHVQDHKLAFSEIHRVLRPGGLSLHIFPSKLAPIEGHVFVPLAAMFQNHAWLTLWALLGVREPSQTNKGFREVAAENLTYLKNHTRYLTRAQITRVASLFFDDITFAERYMIKHSYGKARYIYPLVRVLPAVAWLYSTFYSRVIFLRKSE
jgi:SAM-dependent methyltransferase